MSRPAAGWLSCTSAPADKSPQGCRAAICGAAIRPSPRPSRPIPRPSNAAERTCSIPLPGTRSHPPPCKLGHRTCGRTSCPLPIDDSAALRVAADRQRENSSRPVLDEKSTSGRHGERYRAALVSRAKPSTRSAKPHAIGKRSRRIGYALACPAGFRRAERYRAVTQATAARSTLGTIPRSPRAASLHIWLSVPISAYPATAMKPAASARCRRDCAPAPAHRPTARPWHGPSRSR